MKLIKISALLLLLVSCSDDTAPTDATTPADTDKATGIAADAESIRPLLPGMRAPAFTLTDAAGKPWRFIPGSQHKPLLVTFFRGTWCPYCSRYLWRMREAEQALLDMGYELVFISADQVSVLAQALEQEEKLQYTLLSDNDLVVARAFGIAFQVGQDYVDRLLEHDIDMEAASGRDHHWLPVPATFVIGTDGVIEFQYVNPDYRVRAEPEVILAAARAALKDSP
ncbi:MAG: AhpC/TSA family protein [Gammaproteobacteria bacterium]|nr:AhpC/TSA family protein [Gammaproteobacteria bacterium]NND61499.1 AhpC/TSA family protein [Gammaproteobacteria bacterium]